MNLFSIFRRKPIPYMQRADVKAAIAEKDKARARHVKGADAVYVLTHKLLREGK